MVKEGVGVLRFVGGEGEGSMSIFFFVAITYGIYGTGR